MLLIRIMRLPYRIILHFYVKSKCKLFTTILTYNNTHVTKKKKEKKNINFCCRITLYNDILSMSDSRSSSMCNKYLENNEISEKRKELLKLREKLNIIVKGKENYKSDEVNILVSNHSSFLDYFYVPAAIDDDIVSIIKPVLYYGKNEERSENINKYLNAMPFEYHAGPDINNYNINSAVYLLNCFKSIHIFPEGAHSPYENCVNKGRNGAVRCVFGAKQSGNKVNLIPVGIKTNDSVDNFKIEVNILPQIDYSEDYMKYLSIANLKERKEILYKVTKEAMTSIASALDYDYIDERIKLENKAIILPNGNYIDEAEINTGCNFNKYMLTMQKHIRRLTSK